MEFLSNMESNSGQAIKAANNAITIVTLVDMFLLFFIINLYDPELRNKKTNN